MRKKFTTLFLLCLLPLSSILSQTGSWQDVGNVASFFAGGDGETEASAYQIATPQQLALLAKRVNAGENFQGKYFKLTSDIDLGAHYWVPIGNETSEATISFQGIFDGCEFKVSKMGIKNSYQSVGLWGSIGFGSVIKNVGVVDCNININSQGSVSWAGGLAGYIFYGMVHNCYSTGFINMTELGICLGGLIGGFSENSTLKESSLLACYSTVNIKGNFTYLNDGILHNVTVGGLVGRMDSSIPITACYSTGNIDITVRSEEAPIGGGTLVRVGGVCGEGGPFYCCYSTGNVNVTSQDKLYGGSLSVGGLVGSNFQGSKNSYASGNVISSIVRDYNYVGGLTATMYGKILGNCVVMSPQIKGGKNESMHPGMLKIHRILGDEEDNGENVLQNNYVLNTTKVYIDNKLQEIDVTNPNGLNGLDRSQTELYQRRTYEEDLGWNFTIDDATKWVINEGKSYPTLAWQDVLLYILVHPKNDTIQQGKDYTFSTIVKGKNVSYQWYFNDQAIQGATNNIYTISKAEGKHQGRYKVEVRNESGQLISQEGKLIVRSSLEIDEIKVVGQDQQGQFELKFDIPSNTSLTGSFLLQFPEGVTLDMEQTLLSDELSKNFDLVITPQKNNTWLLEIKAKSLKSLTETGTYQTIMDIAYQVDPALGKGTYEALIKDLDFELNDGTHIIEQERAVNIEVLRYGTAIDKISSGKGCIYLSDQNLVVDTENAESIEIYSVSGVKLYSGAKAAGKAEINISGLPQGVLIVRGGSGWTTKVVK